jgi:outer membrane protein
VGYFIRNNLLIGMGLSLALNSSHPFDLLDKRQVGIGPAPFVQYYIGASNLKPYLGVAYSYSYDQYRYKFPTAGGSSTRKGYSETLTPTLGLAYFLNERVALNTGLSYNFRTRTVNAPNVITPQTILVTSESESQFLSVGFGIQVFLGR